MPGVNGGQVAEVLMTEQPTLQVVICSGCPDNLPESVKWFADGLVSKGDGPGALLAAIDRLVTVGEQLLVATRPTRRPVLRYSAPASGRFDQSRRA